MCVLGKILDFSIMETACGWLFATHTHTRIDALPSTIKTLIHSAKEIALCRVFLLWRKEDE